MCAAHVTVVVPTANPASIASPADLAKSGVKVIAAGDTVPITKYATQLVRTWPRRPGYPADFVARYTANVASKEDNVKALIAKIELGEGDAGIVYVTDAKASNKVTDHRRARRRERPGDLRRRGRQGVQERGRRDRRSSTGSPGRTARPFSARSASCRRLVIDAVPANRAAATRRRRVVPGRRHRSADGRSLARGAGRPVRAVPRPAGLTLVVRVDPRRIARIAPSAHGRARRAGPEPRQHRDQPRDHRGARPPLAVVLARRRFRGKGSSRRSSTCRSCCRRRSPASPCCSCSVAGACWARRSTCSGSPSRSPRWR